MAIRMKEWGMLAPVAQNVNRSGQRQSIHSSVRHTGNRAQSIGQAGQNLSHTLAEVADDDAASSPPPEATPSWEDQIAELEKSASVGKIAKHLSEAIANTAEELYEREESGDIDYLWEKTANSHINDALSSLDKPLREEASKLAPLYASQGKESFKSNHMLMRITNSQNDFWNTLQETIASGDEVTALQLASLGEGTLIAQEQLPEVERNISSSTRYKLWDDAFRNDPLGGLSAYRAASPQELPESEPIRAKLSQLHKDTLRASRAGAAQFLRGTIVDDKPMDEASLTRIEEAGILSDSQIAGIKSKSPHSLRTKDYCQWQARIDSCAPDEDQQVALQLDLAAAALPRSSKRELFARLDRQSQQDFDKRLAFQKRVEQAYEAGQLGTVGDELTWQRLARLQKLLPQALADTREDSLSSLLQQFTTPTTQWVRLRDMNNPTPSPHQA